ncbi:uncharacterized protein BX663DRAFT_502574 [Cokeromyces recurvatus]|uniref:uncharacterized protein n=1 Tax=Cokeromyces recurvatus TaxID=90255 RepID=UPI002220378A|nr:uncharacterized protein BX663DRAFT_502574 [Cokeromyces recurvatus]KAI7904491.1 hypothetical protein BX663DRAFT_502574 [Cokeromyces recurvatus]
MSKRKRLANEDWEMTSSSSTDTDSDVEEIKTEKQQQKPCGLLFLPFEILSNIFILSSNPHLPIVCRQLYNRLYFAPNFIKLQFIMYRAHNDLPKAFEHALRFPFFDMDLMHRFDNLNGKPIPYQDKKIPARLFLSESNTLNDELVLALLERGASPNRPKGYPLIKSAQLGRLDQVKLLIKYGADPTIRNNMALRVCAARNNRAMVDYFLDELKVKPDSETLKVCVHRNLWDMIQVLVDHGAVPDMSTINDT